MGVLESVQGMRVDMLGKPRAKKSKSTARVSATKRYKKAGGLRGGNRDVFASGLTERSDSSSYVQGGPSQTDKLRYTAKCWSHKDGYMYLWHV